MAMITGCLPENLGGGLYRNAEMERSSHDFQWINCGCANPEVFRPPVSLSVQRSSLPVAVSREYVSSFWFAVLRVKANSRLLLRQAMPFTTPIGSLGTGISLFILVSSTCRTLIPSSFASKAIQRPSLERSNSSTSQLSVGVRTVNLWLPRSM